MTSDSKSKEWLAKQVAKVTAEVKRGAIEHAFKFSSMGVDRRDGTVLSLYKCTGCGGTIHHAGHRDLTAREAIALILGGMG